jgi:uncharacterized protein YukE
MPDSSFSVNTTGLGEQIPYMQDLGEQLRSVGTNLRATLAELGPCWGGDATGNQFLDQYQGPRDQLFEGIDGAGEVVDSTSDGIRTMSVQFDRLEDQNTTAAQQLTSGGSDGPSGHDTDSRPGKE